MFHHHNHIIDTNPRRCLLLLHIHLFQTSWKCRMQLLEPWKRLKFSSQSRGAQIMFIFLTDTWWYEGGFKMCGNWWIQYKFPHEWADERIPQRAFDISKQLAGADLIEDHTNCCWSSNNFSRWIFIVAYFMPANLCYYDCFSAFARQLSSKFLTCHFHSCSYRELFSWANS